MIKTLYPCFQHWSAKGSVYIVSDTHFDDADRKYMGYTISSQEEADIIKETVHKTDTLIHLGDVGNPKYLKDLRCYKVLIRGNHDENLHYMEPGENWNTYFNEVYAGPLVIAPKIILSHEPVEVEWALNIHGHDHSGSHHYNGLNLAPPYAGYTPYSLSEILKAGLMSDIPSIHRITISKAGAIHS